MKRNSWLAFFVTGLALGALARFTPKELQRLAGGVSAANTSGFSNEIQLHAEGVPATKTQLLASLWDAFPRSTLPSGVASLNHRLQALTRFA